MFGRHAWQVRLVTSRPRRGPGRAAGLRCAPHMIARWGSPAIRAAAVVGPDAPALAPGGARKVGELSRSTSRRASGWHALGGSWEETAGASASTTSQSRTRWCGATHVFFRSVFAITQAQTRGQKTWAARIAATASYHRTVTSLPSTLVCVRFAAGLPVSGCPSPVGACFLCTACACPVCSCSASWPSLQEAWQALSHGFPVALGESTAAQQPDAGDPGGLARLTNASSLLSSRPQWITEATRLARHLPGEHARLSSVHLSNPERGGQARRMGARKGTATPLPRSKGRKLSTSSSSS